MTLVGIHGQMLCRTDNVIIIGYDKTGAEVVNLVWSFKVSGRVMKTSFKSRKWNSLLSAYQTIHRNIKAKYNISLATGILGDSAIDIGITNMFKCTYFDITFTNTGNLKYNGKYVLLNEQLDLPDFTSNKIEDRSFILRFEGGVNFFEENL